MDNSGKSISEVIKEEICEYFVEYRRDQSDNSFFSIACKIYLIIIVLKYIILNFSLYSQVPSAFGLFLTIIDPLHLILQINTPLAYCLSLIIVLCIVILKYTLEILAIKTKIFHFHSFIKIMHYVDEVFVNCCFLQILTICISTFYFPYYRSKTNLGFTIDSIYGLVPLICAILVILITMILEAIHLIFGNDIRFYTTQPFSGPHSFIKVSNYFCYLCISINHLLSQNIISACLFNVLCIVLALILLYYSIYTMKLPYKSKYKVIILFLYSEFIILPLFNIFVTLFPSQDFDLFTFFMCLVCTILTFALSCLFYLYKKIQIKKESLYITDDTRININLLYLLIERVKDFNASLSVSDLEIIVMHLINHILNCNSITCECKSTFEDISALDISRETEVNASQAFWQSISYFQNKDNIEDVDLNLTNSMIQIYSKQSFTKNILSIEKTELIKHSLINSICMNVIKEEISNGLQSEKSSSKNIHFEKILEHDKGVNNFNKQIFEYSQKSCEMYEMLICPNIDGNLLETLCLELSEKLKNIYKNFYTLDKLYVGNEKIIKIFAKFLDKVLQNRSEGRELLQKLENIVGSGLNKLNRINEETFSIRNQPLSCIISASKNDRGIIKHISSNFCSFLKYQEQELLGNDISMIIPLFIRNQHKELLNREIGKNSFVIEKGFERLKYSVRKDGFIVPLLFYIKIFPKLENGLSIMCLAKNAEEISEYFQTPIGSNSKKWSIILTNNEGNILSINEQAYKHLKIQKIEENSRQSILSNENNISQIIPEFYKIKDDFTFKVAKRIFIPDFLDTMEEVNLLKNHNSQVKRQIEVFIKVNELSLNALNHKFYEAFILLIKNDKLNSVFISQNYQDNLYISGQQKNEKEELKENQNKMNETELKKNMEDKISLNQSIDSSQSSSDSINRVSNLKRQIKENKMPYALNILDLMMNFILLILIILVIVDFAIRYNLYNNLEINIEYLLKSIEKSYEYFALGIKLINYFNLVSKYYSLSEDPTLLLEIKEQKINTNLAIQSFYTVIVDTENINSIYNFAPEIKSDDIIPFYHITLDQIFFVNESYRNSLFISIYYLENLINTPIELLKSDFCYISLIDSCLTEGIKAHSEIDQQVFYILENGIKYIRERNKYYRATALQYALDLCSSNKKIIFILTMCYSSFILISLIGITPLIIYVENSIKRALLIYSILDKKAIKESIIKIQNNMKKVSQKGDTSRKIQKNTKMKKEKNSKININSLEAKEDESKENNELEDTNIMNPLDSKSTLKKENESTPLIKNIEYVGKEKELSSVSTNKIFFLFILFIFGGIMIGLFWIFYFISSQDMDLTSTSVNYLTNINYVSVASTNAFNALRMTLVKGEIISFKEIPDLVLYYLKSGYREEDQVSQLYSNTPDPLKNLVIRLKEYETENYCFLLFNSDPKVASECKVAYDNFLDQGISYALNKIFMLIQKLYYRFEEVIKNNGNKTKEGLDIRNSYEFTELKDILILYTQDYFVRMEKISLEEVFFYFNSIIIRERNKCILVVFFILIIQFTLWRLFLHFLKRDISKSRKILDVIGTDLIEANPLVQKKIKELIK